MALSERNAHLAIDPSLSQTLDKLDGCAPPIKFALWLYLRIFVGSRRMAKNTGRHFEDPRKFLALRQTNVELAREVNTKP